MICSKRYMVVQHSLKPTDLQLPACFVYQSLSKELESSESKNIVVLSARWNHHDCLLLIRPGGATGNTGVSFCFW